MKKKVIIVFVILLIVFLVIGIVGKIKYDEQKQKEQEIKENRYQEIKDSVKAAVEWQISAVYPKCTISKEVRGNESHHYNSSNLINNGYLKKKELLDVDGKSYCDVYVKVYKYNYQDSCEMSYKLFLKCEDFKEKGYINWG